MNQPHHRRPMPWRSFSRQLDIYSTPYQSNVQMIQMYEWFMNLYGNNELAYYPALCFIWHPEIRKGAVLAGKTGFTIPINCWRNIRLSWNAARSCQLIVKNWLSLPPKNEILYDYVWIPLTVVRKQEIRDGGMDIASMSLDLAGTPIWFRLT